MAPPGNDWNQWQKHVLAELQRFNGWLNKLANEQQELRVEITTLKVKASLWGALSGAAAVVILIVVQFLKG